MDFMDKARLAAHKFARLGFTVIASKSYVHTDRHTKRKTLRLKNVGAGKSYKSLPEYNGGLEDFGMKDISEFAAKVGGDYIVFDVDVKGEYKGLEALEMVSDVCRFNFFQQASIITQTPSGGYHLYFRLPRDMNGDLHIVKWPKNINGIPSGLEIFCEGKHCVHLPDSYIPPFLDFDRPEEAIYELVKGEEILEAGDRGLITILPLEVIAALQKITKGKDHTIVTEIGVKKAIETTKYLIEDARQKLSYEPPSIEGNQGDRQMFVAACICARIGLSEEEALVVLEEYNLRSVPVWSNEQLLVKIASAYNNAEIKSGIIRRSHIGVPWVRELMEKSMFTLDEKARVAKLDYSNMLTAILNSPISKGRLSFNELSGRVEYDGVNISDKIATDIRASIAVETGLSNRDAFEVMLPTAAQEMKSYNPFKDYMESLPEWDGKRRAENLFIDYYGLPDSKFLREVSKMVSTALVAKPLIAGAKFDYMVILPGRGGAGKSTFISTLAIDPKYFYCGEIKVNDAKKMSEIGIKQVVEWQELVGAGSQGLQALKQFLTTEESEIRKAYARYETLVVKFYVMFATTNFMEFLPVSDRRFLVLPRMDGDDAKKLKEKIDREGKQGKVVILDLFNDLKQIYAEVYQNKWHESETLCLSEESEEIAESIRKYAVVSESFEQELENWLHGRDSLGREDKELENFTKKISNTGRDEYPPVLDRDIFHKCFGRDFTSSKAELRSVQSSMQKFGFVKERIMRDGIRGTFYLYQPKNKK